MGTFLCLQKTVKHMNLTNWYCFKKLIFFGQVSHKHVFLTGLSFCYTCKNIKNRYKRQL